MRCKTWLQKLDPSVCTTGARSAPCKLHRFHSTAGFMRDVRLTVFTAAAGLLLAVGNAFAGDYYLRGGIGFDHPGKAIFTDIDCSLTSPAALYGCGTGGDGAPYRSRGSFGTVPAIELGLGYSTGAVRYEMLLEYRPSFTFEGRANFLAPDRRQFVMMDLSSVSGMLAGFVDFRRPGQFTPFIGAGIGSVRTRTDPTTMIFPATTTTVPGGSRTGLAWMVTAGAGVALSERITLELAWRYTDLGEVRTGQGPGSVVWRDGSRDPLPLDLAPTRSRLAGHGIRVSLRRSF